MRTDTYTCNNGKSTQIMVSISEILVDTYDDVSYIETMLEEALTQLACNKIKHVKGGEGL